MPDFSGDFFFESFWSLSSLELSEKLSLYPFYDLEASASIYSISTLSSKLIKDGPLTCIYRLRISSNVSFSYSAFLYSRHMQWSKIIPRVQTSIDEFNWNLLSCIEALFLLDWAPCDIYPLFNTSGGKKIKSLSFISYSSKWRLLMS